LIKDISALLKSLPNFVDHEAKSAAVSERVLRKFLQWQIFEKFEVHKQVQLDLAQSDWDL